MRRTSGTIDVPARLSIDGWRLFEEWIAPDPWSWVYRTPLTRLALLAILLATLSCAGVPAAVVPPIVVPPPPVVVVVVPVPLTHDLSAWADADAVCVDVPKVQALYRAQRCVGMGALRSLILTARSAE